MRILVDKQIQPRMGQANVDVGSATCCRCSATAIRQAWKVLPPIGFHRPGEDRAGPHHRTGLRRFRCCSELWFPGELEDRTQLTLDDLYEQRRLFAIFEQIDRTDTEAQRRNSRGP